MGATKTVLYLGLALVALWLVLTIARVAVGGLLWLVLIAGLIALAVAAYQHFTHNRSHTRTPV